MSIKLIFASTAALALIAGAPAQAAKNESARALAAAEGAAAADSKAKGERKICRTFDNSASRMKRERLCLTREQWKKFEEAQAQ